MQGTIPKFLVESIYRCTIKAVLWFVLLGETIWHQRQPYEYMLPCHLSFLISASPCHHSLMNSASPGIDPSWTQLHLASFPCELSFNLPSIPHDLGFTWHPSLMTSVSHGIHPSWTRFHLCILPTWARLHLSFFPRELGFNCLPNKPTLLGLTVILSSKFQTSVSDVNSPSDIELQTSSEKWQHHIVCSDLGWHCRS